MSSWSTEETNLLIRKRLEMFGCARSDKVYDQISLWLAEQHHFYKNAAACQTRFNNVLKTYRSCVKRLNSGGMVCKLRFPYFDVFHEYYSKQEGGGGGGGIGRVESSGSSEESKCKSEIFLEDMFEDNSYVGDPTGPSVESMLMDSMHTDVDFQSGDSPQRDRGDDELTTSLTATNGGTVEDLKLRLMEQKLLYYTNQNMLLQMKQVHYRQKEQDRARGQLMAEEILRVLKGIHSCLKKTAELRVTRKEPESKPIPVQIAEEPDRKPDLKEQDEQLEEEEAEEEELEEPEAGGLHLYVESDEDDDEDVVVEENGMDVQQQPPSSPERTVKKEVGRLKVRKNIFPPWNRIQTVLLIKIHCDLRPKFKGYNLFECVSNKLIELHINRTPRDCRTRWNNLFRTYKDCRSRLRVNEKAAVKFEYFDEIDAYFKDKEFLTL